MPRARQRTTVRKDGISCRKMSRVICDYRLVQIRVFDHDRKILKTALVAIECREPALVHHEQLRTDADRLSVDIR